MSEDKFEDARSGTEQREVAGAAKAVRLRKRVPTRPPDEELCVCAKVWLTKEGTGIGPGVVRLLSLIDETGAVKDSCTMMGLSYSKGWKLLENAEKQLGTPAIRTQRGGAGGGWTSLSPEGSELVRKYEQFNKEATSYLNELFAKYFGGAK